MGLGNFLKTLLKPNYKLKSQDLEKLLEDIGHLIDDTGYDYKVLYNRPYCPEKAQILIFEEGFDE